MTPSSPNTAQTTPRQDAVDRLEMWAAALEADPGRAAHFGCPVGQTISPTYWNRDLAADIRAALSPAPEAGEKGLITDLTHARAYRDGLRAGFRMGEGSEAERYEAALSKIHAEITEAAFQPPATSSAKVPSSLEDALRGIINFIRAEEPLTESRAAILGSLLDQADAALTPVSA